jgi:UDP-N-acetylmuramoyl-tripeptide--D-alanyl-D-alanine ligase
MKVALESFNEETYNSKMVILGDMFELGETSNKEHQNILVKLSELSFDGKVVVGENFNCNNCDEDIIAFKSTYELKAWFDTLDIEGLSILIKGSRGMKLESILES